MAVGEHGCRTAPARPSPPATPCHNGRPGTSNRQMGEVADTPGADALFGQERARLWSVAYRMLGSRADAEDVLQDAWLRWQASDVRGIHNAQAWLVTTVTRLCIDRLRRLHTERELYTGPWLPEPLVATEPPPADAAAELASDLSV